MIDELSRVARWEKWNERKKRYVSTDPPDKMVAVLLSRFGRWRFPYARGIISTPTLRSDGSLITRPGLDEPSGYYLALAPGFHLPPISEHPQSFALILLPDGRRSRRRSALMRHGASWFASR